MEEEGREMGKLLYLPLGKTRKAHERKRKSLSRPGVVQKVSRSSSKCIICGDIHAEQRHFVLAGQPINEFICDACF